MAFPSVDAVLTQQFASSTSTFNIDLPSTVASGDLLLILFAHNDSGAGINLVSGPSGFTHLFEIDNSNYVQAEAWAKVADGTEGGTSVTAEFNVSRSGCAQVYRVSNWEGTLSGLEWATPTTYTSGTSRTPPALSPSWGAADTLWIAFAACGDDDEAFTGAPTSYTNLTSVVSGGGTNAGCSVGTARRGSNTATETPSGSFTIANTEQWELTTFGIKPAAGGGGSSVTVNAASFGFSAQPVAATASTVLLISAAAFSWAAKTVTAIQSTVVSVGAAAFSWTARTLNVSAATRIIVNSATFAFSAKTLTAANQLALQIGAAAFNWTAQALTTVQHTVLTIGAAAFQFTRRSFSFTGQQITLVVRRMYYRFLGRR